MMDISILKRNAMLGVYEIDADIISSTGQMKRSSASAVVTQEKLRKQLREDCILAAISQGCTRHGSKQIFEVAYANASIRGNREVALTMVELVKRVT